MIPIWLVYTGVGVFGAIIGFAVGCLFDFVDRG